MKPGEAYELSVPYLLPMNAPAGAYHLKLSYQAGDQVFEKLFENIFALEPAT